MNPNTGRDRQQTPAPTTRRPTPTADTANATEPMLDGEWQSLRPIHSLVVALVDDMTDEP